MNSGYYAACAGLKTQTQALDLIANNLANLGSAGYRAQQAQFQSILAAAHPGLLDPLNRAVNNFNVMSGARLDFSNGNLQTTGNALDLALEGSGFFAVQTSSGIRYTRNGAFQQSSDGRLVTVHGDAVLGEQGPIALPAGEITISADGTLSVAGALAGKLRLVDLRGAEVAPAGNSYYTADASQIRPARDTVVRQGALESANLDATAEIANLITVQRHAEMLARALSSFHSDFNRIATQELARV